jgi:Phage integrase family
MYSVGWNSFVQYCAEAKRTPLPLTEEALMHWASSTALNGCKHSTIKSYLAGIRSAAIMHGFDVSDLSKMQRLKLVLRALKSIAPHTATRLPITNDILLKIRPHMKLDTYEGKVMWAAFTFAHSCLMRCGEFTALAYKDKNFLSLEAWKWEDGAQHGTVTLSHSKTSKQPVDIYVFANGSDTCPVLAMTKYMSSRIKRRYSIRLDSPLFAMEDGTPLTRKALSNALRNALVAARVPNAELYKGHSFRRGGATSLARVGVADSVIKTIGRWKSHAYQLYVDIDLNIMCSAAMQVGKLKAMFGGNDVSSSVRR